MDDEIEQLMVSVRADTQGFARDVATMRSQIDGPLIEGLGRAGQVLERGLLSALRRGALGFEDLKRIALAVMEEIAAAAISRGLASIGLGGDGGAPLGAGLLTSLLGLPGRATGGPVTAGRPYLVGERGPELFVPSGYGRVEPRGSAAGTRDVRVSISINAGTQSAPAALQASSRQVARAVRRALIEE
jgi:phage-related minor tail protein